MSRCTSQNTADVLRVPVVAKRDEFGMAKVVIERPFKELDHGYQLRLQPAASFHVFGGEPSPHLPFSDSGRFRNGHSEIDRPSKFENTVRREAGVKPLRIRAHRPRNPVFSLNQPKLS